MSSQMTRQKKQLMEKGTQRNSLKDLNSPSNKLNRNAGSNHTQPRDRQHFNGPDYATLTLLHNTQSMTLNRSGLATKPAFLSFTNLKPVLLQRAVVCIEDISRSPDFKIADMVKKQLTRCSADGKSSRTTNSPKQQVDLVLLKSGPQSAEAGTNDKSASSSSKNIFEQLRVAGRRSPRIRSNSPRSQLSSSLHNEHSGAQSSSVEKQETSVVTAVRTLRGLSGHAAEGQDKDKSEVTSTSPCPTSPFRSESTSPKRQSPRRMSQKMSPPDVVSQKSPRVKKSPAGSDCSTSPTSPTRSVKTRSPRRIGEDVNHQINSLSCSSSSQHQDIIPAIDTSARSEKSCAKVENSSDSTVHEQAIQILSSTSCSSRVVQVDPQISSPTARRLFVDIHHEQLKQFSNSCDNKSINKRHSPCSAESSSPADSSTSTKLKKPGNLASEESESLLCAMLVGGSEVTKSYVQSREQNAVHISNTHSRIETDSFEPKPSESNSRLFNSNDSFFDDDDDFAENMPEVKQYELPLLSRLPPLSKINHAVLELTKTEEHFQESLPPVDCPPGHCTKTSSLLNLISRVKDCLPSNSAKCRKVILDAEEALQQLSCEESNLNIKPSVPELYKVSQPDKETSESVEGNENCEHSCAENVELPAKIRGVEISPSSLLENCVVSDVQLQNTATAGDDMVIDVPSSPCSLGELDTARITEAATLAVQTHIQSESDVPSMNDESTENIKGEFATSTDSCQFTERSHVNSSQDIVQSLSGVTETACPQASSSQTALSGSSSGSYYQPRSFFNRISSPSKLHWKPKTETVSNPGRPAWSKWHTVMSPLPIDILSRHESSNLSKSAAFASRELDLYLRQPVNRLIVPACKDSRLAKILLAEGFIKDYDDLQRRLNGEDENFKNENEEGSVKSEDEEGEEDERDSELARKIDPDFDEVVGLVFVSFPSEMAVMAHSNLEKNFMWEGDYLAYLNMAKFHAFEESRRREGKIRRESQGLRGQHMKWRRYQRLYRKELRKLYEESNKDIPWPLSKLPEKTCDIQKIKNWKKKFGDLKTEELEALELLGEKEEKVKRKRKTYVFSSKKKRPKRVNITPEVPAIKKEVVDSLAEDPESSDDSEEEDSFYGVPIPIDEDGYMDDVQSSLEEMRRKEKGLKQSKGIFARFNMGPEDRHIFKKLGGWVTRFRRFRRMPSEMKEGGESRRRSRKRHAKGGQCQSQFELKSLSTGDVRRALSVLQLKSNADDLKVAKQLTFGCANAVDSVVEAENKMDLNAEESLPEYSGEKLHCDKPGCRYGCICHMCLPSAEMDEMDQSVTPAPVGHACDKEYCRLGCICERLEKPGIKQSPDSSDLAQDKETIPEETTAEPCTMKPFEKDEYLCQPEIKVPDSKEDCDMQHLSDIGQEESDEPSKEELVDHGESSGDELPMLEKTTPRRQRCTDRYSNLPRRQTSYRMAKNLDAVSRKAMMMWETSEVYSEQTSNRKKKMPETTMPSVTTSPTPAVMSSSSSATQLSNTATASVSVNTLPLMMPSQLVMLGVTTMPSSPAFCYSMLSNSQSMSVAPDPRTAQDTSPVVVSDDEGKTDNLESADDPSNLGKRPQSKPDESEDITGRKVQKNSNSPESVHTPPTIPDSSHPDASKRQIRWHTSLICLKASNPMASTLNNNNDDIMEEDEIKLFEFIVNCSWERSKKEILTAITNTLKRGVYPEPRTMRIGDFKVEILPKAPRPSTIPMELRNRLPKAMYSVRVRVTEIPKHTSPQSITKPSVVIPVTPTPAFHTGVPPIQGLLPTSALQSGQCNAQSPVVTSSSANLTSTSHTASGNVGISGLGHLQITRTKSADSSMIRDSQLQSMQHFKIQKDNSEVNSGEQGEKKKKKKKKKKKSKDPSDDSLVPDLKNLTVSPKKSQNNSLSMSKCPPVVTTPAPVLSLSRQTSNSSLRPPVVSKVTSSLLPHSLPAQPIIRLPASSSGSGLPVRPQLLGLSNLPPNLSGVKFLHLPGQNNLLQIVPASALGLKPMDNKNVPNFVAVPVSLTSVAPAGLGSKKPGSKIQVDIPSKIFTQMQQDATRQSGSAKQSATKRTASAAESKNEKSFGSAAGNSAVSSGGAPVKKKKKKKSKKMSEDDNCKGSGRKSVTNVSPNPPPPPSVLVASSPYPVLNFPSPCPVHLVKNTASTHSSEDSVGHQHLEVSSTAAGALGRNSQVLKKDITMTTGEVTVNLVESGMARNCSRAKAQESGAVAPDHDGLGKSKGSLERQAVVVSTTASNKLSRGDAVVSSRPTTAASVPFVSVSREDGQASVASEDSRGSDSLDLSSDWEDYTDFDTGTDSPASGDMMSAEKVQNFLEQRLVSRRKSEQRRRADLKAGYRELLRVMNVAKNLPKSLSQQQILSKALSLLEFHKKLSSKLQNNLAILTEKHHKLKQQHEFLLEQHLAEGTHKTSMQIAETSRLFNADLPQESIKMNAALSNPWEEIEPCLVQSFKTSYPSRSKNSNLQRYRRSIAEIVDGEKKSRFIIEIDKAGEDLVPYEGEAASSETSSHKLSDCLVTQSTGLKNLHTEHTVLEGNTTAVRLATATNMLPAGGRAGIAAGSRFGEEGDRSISCTKNLDKVTSKGGAVRSKSTKIVNSGNDVRETCPAVAVDEVSDTGEEFGCVNHIDSGEKSIETDLVITSVTTLQNFCDKFNNDTSGKGDEGDLQHLLSSAGAT